MRELPQYVRKYTTGAMPQTDYSASLQAAKQTGQISEALGGMALDMYNRGVEIEKTKALATMKAALNEQYMQAQSDPDALRALQNGYKKGFISGIKSPDLAEKFSMIYDTEANALIAKATELRVKIQGEEHERAILEAIDSSINSGANYVDNIFSDIPEHVLGTERALGANKISFEELISAKNSDGTHMFTPNQQVMFKRKLENGLRIKAEKAQAAYLADQALQQTDFAGWAESKGWGLEQIIAHQGDDPEVIGNAKAKLYAENIKHAPSIDDFAKMAGSIKEEYGDYADKALLKIARNLPADKASALNLALRPDSATYTPQIQMLHDLANIKDSELDEAYRASYADEKPADLEKTVYGNETVARNAAAMREEGNGAYSLPYLQQTARLAKYYRIQNPGATEEEAAEFANKYTQDSFQFGKVNGVDYRIPVNLPNGRKFKPNEVDEVDGYIRDTIPSVEAYVGERRVVRKDNIVPILSNKGDGVFLKQRIRDGAEFNDVILFGKNGAPVEIKFEDALKKSRVEAETTEDLKRKRELYRRRAASLPYNEREALRKEMFPETIK